MGAKKSILPAPMTVVLFCGGEWALHARIGMTINLSGHPMSVTQHYLAIDDAHFIRVVYSLHHFQKLKRC